MDSGRPCESNDVQYDLIHPDSWPDPTVNHLCGGAVCPAPRWLALPWTRGGHVVPGGWLPAGPPGRGAEPNTRQCADPRSAT